MRIVFATGNEGKLREIKAILKDVDAGIFSLRDEGITLEREENGLTFSENSMIKAQEAYEKLLAAGRMKDTVVLSDDSGLCIDHLGGEPGVHSARYMGHDTPYAVKNQAILDLMKDVPMEKRGAAFVCSMTAIAGDGRRFQALGELKGYIAYESAGLQGFGYDPIFYLPEYKMTSGQLRADEKNDISHRAQVLHRIKDILLEEGIIRLKEGGM